MSTGEQKRKMMKNNMYNRQLFIMGILAIIIAPLVLFDTVIVYGLPFLNSISESGTIANQTSPILPTILGSLAIFGFSYKSKWNSRGDNLCTKIMAVGFLLVAFQMCGSDYVIQNRVGVFGLSKELSNIVHSVGALTGFGALLVWQLFFFTKSSGTKTREKVLRNKIYYACSTLSIIGILIFIIGAIFDLAHYVFWAEFVILTLAGISCITKSEILNIFRDKEVNHE